MNKILYASPEYGSAGSTMCQGDIQIVRRVQVLPAVRGQQWRRSDGRRPPFIGWDKIASVSDVSAGVARVEFSARSSPPGTCCRARAEFRNSQGCHNQPHCVNGFATSNADRCDRNRATTARPPRLQCEPALHRSRPYPISDEANRDGLKN